MFRFVVVVGYRVAVLVVVVVGVDVLSFKASKCRFCLHFFVVVFNLVESKNLNFLIQKYVAKSFVVVDFGCGCGCWHRFGHVVLMTQKTN